MIKKFLVWSVLFCVLSSFQVRAEDPSFKEKMDQRAEAIAKKAKSDIETVVAKADRDLSAFAEKADRDLDTVAEAAHDDLEADHEMHRGEKIALWFEDKGLNRTAAIAAISTLPIVELRGAVPAGHVLLDTAEMEGAEKWKVSLKIFLIAVAGNMIPIPFILLLLGPVSRYLMRFALGKKFFEWLFARTRKKSASIEKYEAVGLTLFVAIPLPVTGGWTGAMAAFLMGIPFWKSMLYILLGVMIAGAIMTALSLLGKIGAIIAGTVLLALVAGAVLKSFKK